MNINIAKFEKIWIVGHFHGNYLKIAVYDVILELSDSCEYFASALLM